MITFFTIGNINELVLKGHSYISKIGIKIIDDKNYKSSSILEGHFYDFLNLLEIIELRKDVETTDDKLQKLVLRLYGYVENECIYYNGFYLDMDDPMFSGSVVVVPSGGGISVIEKTRLDIIDNTNPTVIDWNNDIVPTPGDGRTWATKHGKIGYVFTNKWKNSTTGKYEKSDAFTIEDSYDISDNLETVTINVFDLPFRFTIV